MTDAARDRDQSLDRRAVGPVKDAAPVAEQLGCAFDEGPVGACARSDDTRQTTVPGVFATGDVRAGNVKRVAFAVGEGATAASLVH